MNKSGRKTNILHRLFITRPNVFGLVGIGMLIMVDICEAGLFNGTPGVDQILSCAN
jgi:hypothetical protein